MTIEILEAARVPVTAEALALRLGLPSDLLLCELERLERRGYVQRTSCTAGSYTAGSYAPGACARCSLRAICTGTETTWVATPDHARLGAAPSPAVARR